MSTPTPEQIRDFVIAGHWNLGAIQTMLAEQPALLNAAHAWSEADHETAIQAAAHVGHVAIAEFLLARGAPLAVPTAAMLGRRAAVERLLAEDPARITEAGAHGIPLQAHAAFSGDAALVHWLYEQGARAGVSMALGHAAQFGHFAVVQWLLANTQPDFTWKNWQDKTALTLAREGGYATIVAALQAAGAA